MGCRDFVICSGCGQEVPLIAYRRHVREQCANRLVPCKNHPLGCPVMVRMQDRRTHEFVDSRREAQARTCLYMGGQGAHIFLVLSPIYFHGDSFQTFAVDAHVTFAAIFMVHLQLFACKLSLIYSRCLYLQGL
jgi:hypothetical protein